MKHKINPSISVDCGTTKPIAIFSRTPHVQQVHTKAEVVHLTPGLLGLWVLSIIIHMKCIAKHMINPRISAVWSTTQPIELFSCTRKCLQCVKTLDSSKVSEEATSIPSKPGTQSVVTLGDTSVRH